MSFNNQEQQEQYRDSGSVYSLQANNTTVVQHYARLCQQIPNSLDKRGPQDMKAGTKNEEQTNTSLKFQISA